MTNLFLRSVLFVHSKQMNTINSVNSKVQERPVPRHLDHYAILADFTERELEFRTRGHGIGNLTSILSKMPVIIPDIHPPPYQHWENGTRQ